MRDADGDARAREATRTQTGARWPSSILCTRYILFEMLETARVSTEIESSQICFCGCAPAHIPHTPRAVALSSVTVSSTVIGLSVRSTEPRGSAALGHPDSSSSPVSDCTRGTRPATLVLAVPPLRVPSADAQRSRVRPKMRAGGHPPLVTCPMAHARSCPDPICSLLTTRILL